MPRKKKAENPGGEMIIYQAAKGAPKVQVKSSNLFAREKDKSFKSTMATVYQTFGGKDLYPSVEEKAAQQYLGCPMPHGGRKQGPGKRLELGDMENLPDPDVLALKIVENLDAGLNSFKNIIATLNGK